MAQALPLLRQRLLVMKSNTIKNTFKGIGFSLFMAVGLMAFSNTEASAQYRDRNDRQERRDDRDNRNGNWNNRNGNDLYRIAQQNGLQDGRQAGREDRRDRDRRDSAQKTSEYRKATNGYYARLGNKNTYKNAYRQAFLQGYENAYNRNGRGNNRNGY